jgi:tetratricopeptide (TPR) repeat protein
MITTEQLASAILTVYSLHSQGKYRDAETIAEMLLMIEPSNAYLHLLLASSCQWQQKFQKAIHEYTRTIELQPNDVSAHVNRGEVYLKTGKFLEAFEDLKRASVLNKQPQNPFANRARLLLDMTTAALRAAK